MGAGVGGLMHPLPLTHYNVFAAGFPPPLKI